MRRPILAMLVALSLGVLLYVSSSFAQDQGEAKSRQILTKVKPVYPDLARRMQIRGTVKVETIIAASGNVKSTHVVGGSPLLSQARSEEHTSELQSLTNLVCRLLLEK